MLAIAYAACACVCGVFNNDYLLWLRRALIETSSQRRSIRGQTRQRSARDSEPAAYKRHDIFYNLVANIVRDNNIIKYSRVE
jgi:hypothetical protein